MTFNTLKVIENLLSKNVEKTELMYKKVCEKVNKLYQDEANEVEGFIPEKLEYWKEFKKIRYKEYSEARDALNDFLQHDWH